MFSSQSEKRQSRLLTQLCVLLRILCQVFYNRTLTNSNLPHNRGHGFRKIITLQGCSNLAHHKLSRLAEVINIISSLLILGKSDQARHPGAQDISTMVKQVQQDLPVCRHPDSSRAYLVSGHDRMGDATSKTNPRVSPWWPCRLPVWDQHHQHSPPLLCRIKNPRVRPPMQI